MHCMLMRCMLAAFPANQADGSQSPNPKPPHACNPRTHPPARRASPAARPALRAQHLPIRHRQQRAHRPAHQQRPHSAAGDAGGLCALKRERRRRRCAGAGGRLALLLGNSSMHARMLLHVGCVHTMHPSTPMCLHAFSTHLFSIQTLMHATNQQATSPPANPSSARIWPAPPTPPSRASP
jgi:hypothetical protein